MQVICDFHIHSKYSRSTSQTIDLEGISKGAKEDLKGKLEKIRKELREHPEGLWIREIARKTGLAKFTLASMLTSI